MSGCKLITAGVGLAAAAYYVPSAVVAVASAGYQTGRFVVVDVAPKVFQTVKNVTSTTIDIAPTVSNGVVKVGQTTAAVATGIFNAASVVASPFIAIGRTFYYHPSLLFVALVIGGLTVAFVKSPLGKQVCTPLNFRIGCYLVRKSCFSAVKSLFSEGKKPVREHDERYLYDRNVRRTRFIPRNHQRIL